jgi:SpoVK/Ycf46/Vps4 family AAA+-type ATPase
VFKCPLIRVDLGAIKDKFMGSSERNLRQVFETAENLGRCVVWFDEIEKSLAGSGSNSGAADGGVAADQLGALLSWMQDKPAECFVVATCNSVEALPPEFLRRGRFDDIFFVDLPNHRERQEILAATLRAHGRGSLAIDLARVADATNRFTGAEVAQLVPDALLRAFTDSERELTTEDLVAVTTTVVPLAETAKEKIAALQAWAKTRARPATSPESVASAGARTLALD